MARRYLKFEREYLEQVRLRERAEIEVERLRGLIVDWARQLDDQDPSETVADGGVTAGMVFAKEMRDALLPTAARPRSVVMPNDLIRDGVPDGMTLREAMSSIARHLVKDALARSGGSTTATARRLGMSREGFYRARRRLGMPVRQGGPVPVPEDWRERLG